MNLNPWAYIAIAVAVLSFLGGYGYWADQHGYNRATKEYLPQLTTLQNLIEQGDEAAKSLIDEQEKNYAKIKATADTASNNAHSYYERMRQAEAAAKNSSIANGTKTVDGRSGESGLAGRDTTFTGCPIDREEKVEHDARVANVCKEFIIRNKFPIGE